MTAQQKSDEEVIVTEEQLVSLDDALQHLRDHGNPILKFQIEQGAVQPIPFAMALGLRPQMVYTYIKKNVIRSRRSLETNHVVIDLADAVKWAQGYLERKAQTKAKIDKELRGE
jgi:hypothetical protein